MIDLEKLKRIKRTATRRYNIVKQEGKGSALDRLNYLSAKLTSTALLEAIQKGEINPTEEEYDYWLEGYNWMFKK